MVEEIEMKKASQTPTTQNAFNSLIESKSTTLSRINQMFSTEMSAISLISSKIDKAKIEIGGCNV